MAIQNNFPNLTPTLLLDFANAGKLDPRVTFSRATTATYFNSLGVLTTANSNVARFDYDPSTLAAQGLLIEEQRTNSIRNNTMQGAVAGTPGTLPTNWAYAQLSTLTTEIVGTGTESGITYIDIRISGTATTTALIYFEANSTVAATNNQAWATSVFVKIVGGGTTNITNPATTLRMSDSGGVNLGFLVGSSITLPTSGTRLSACRFSSSHTTNNASTAFVMPAFAFTAAGAIDITLRIGLPQLELGAFATSVIPTTTTALTRNADVASMTGTNFSSWYNQTEGTLYVEGVGVNNVGAGTRRYAEINDNTPSERILVGYGFTTACRYLVSDGGATQADIGVNATTGGALVKAAATYKVNDFQQATNGVLGTADTSGTLPTVDRMFIGQAETTAAATMLNGTIRRIAYYPVRVTNAQLQALTG